MSIAFDASAASTQQTTSPVTWSHTTTGSNVVLFVFFLTNGTPTAYTYNGNPLILISSSPAIAGFKVYAFYQIVGAGVGAQTISITDGTGNNFNGLSWSGSAAAQTGIPDAQNLSTNSNGTAAFSIPLTTIADQDWLIAAVYDNFGSGLGAGASTTLRRTGAFGGWCLFDSNTAESPPGTYNLNITCSTSHNCTFVGLSLAPPVATVVYPVPQFQNKPRVIKYQNPVTVDGELDSQLVGYDTDGTDVRQDKIMIANEHSDASAVLWGSILRELRMIRFISSGNRRKP